MNSTIEPHQSQLSEVQPVAVRSSPAIYGLGSFGIESLVTVFSGFHMFYYIDGLGLAVAMAATINVMHAIWNTVSYPLMGFLSDKTRTRWGRRRPWLSAGLPFFIVPLILVYAVPKPLRQGNALFGYVLVAFFLFDRAYSIMWVNYSALFPELIQGFGNGREPVHTFRARHAGSAFRHRYPTYHCTP